MPAFTKALKDPFVHARVAGLMGFMATIDCFEVDELASKVIPSMSFTLVDTERLVMSGSIESVFVLAELFRLLDWSAIKLSRRLLSS